MHHQIKHKFLKFEQSNNLQLINFLNINFQSNNLHLFLLKSNKGGAHHILWRWRPVEAVAADGAGDREGRARG
jgi:hypothetical protein